MELLNRFSAEAMATPLLVGSHDVEALRGQSCYAGAWAGKGRPLLAIHNETATRQQPVVRISGDACKRAGFKPGPKGWLRTLDAYAQPADHSTIITNPDGAGGIEVTVVLEAGEGLLGRLESDR